LAFDLALFYVFAAVAVGTSLLVVGQSNPVYSVLLLIASFGALAGLYVLLSAPFVAVIQIIVYAGAIMVLFLFVVMLLNTAREEGTKPGVLESSSARTFGVLMAAALVFELIWALSRSGAAGASARQGLPEWTIAGIGQVIFQDYAFAFEATSILILVAMVGAVTLAGRGLPERKR
jgi:NADH-quinone oxidoreductase subunit J